MSKIEKGKVFAAAHAIGYAQGGVVSKEFISNPGGSVTLFSFDQGQGLSEHSAPYDALIQVLEGEMLLQVAGDSHRIAAGESFIIPANAPHSVQAGRPFKMLITMVRG